jgi:hypothetical protein
VDWDKIDISEWLGYLQLAKNMLGDPAYQFDDQKIQEILKRTEEQVEAKEIE